MANQRISYERKGALALLTMDDGKANALSHEMIDEIHACLDRAESDAGAVVLAGRAGRMSGGFDMGTMTAGPDSVRRLVTDGAELLLRMYMFPRPLVAACTGHALAAGAILLLASDLRIGARGDFKIGLNEVSISMTLPVFGVELARARLSPRHLTAAVTRSRIYDPEGAVEAGFLDAVETPERLMEAATAEAERLAKLPDPAFRATKANERQATVAFIRSTLEEDMASIGRAA